MSRSVDGIRFQPYEQALQSNDLSTDDRHGAFVGLGSTYRVLGRYDKAAATLDRGLQEFPGMRRSWCSGP